MNIKKIKKELWRFLKYRHRKLNINDNFLENCHRKSTFYEGYEKNCVNVDLSIMIFWELSYKAHLLRRF